MDVNSNKHIYIQEFLEYFDQISFGIEDDNYFKQFIACWRN